VLSTHDFVLQRLVELMQFPLHRGDIRLFKRDKFALNGQLRCHWERVKQDGLQQGEWLGLGWAPWVVVRQNIERHQ
jgi:hypothetical protein